MLDVLLSKLPEIVGIAIAIWVAVARTTDTAFDNKLAKLAKENRQGIVSAIRSLAGDSKKGKKE